jgi:CRISPR/Cas system-associated exonuclease Cas4 (RecB family)
MLRPPFTFSQTSLQDYADCPRRFQLRYLDKLIYPAEESEPALENERHLREGQDFHRMAQQHFLGIPNEKLEQLANTSNLQKWWEDLLTFSQASLTGLRSLLPEVTLSAPLGDFRLVAKYDLITVTADEKLIIYDWKTYRKKPRNEWLATRWQTRVYLALLVVAGNQFNVPAGGKEDKPITPERCEMVYWFANYPAEPARFPYNQAQYKRDWDALVKLTGEIQSASDYPQTEDRQKCAYCPYRSFCDRGIRAGNLDELESELDSEASFDLNFEQIGEIEF